MTGKSNVPLGIGGLVALLVVVCAGCHGGIATKFRNVKVKVFEK